MAYDPSSLRNLAISAINKAKSKPVFGIWRAYDAELVEISRVKNNTYELWVLFVILNKKDMNKAACVTIHNYLSTSINNGETESDCGKILRVFAGVDKLGYIEGEDLLAMSRSVVEAIKTQEIYVKASFDFKKGVRIGEVIKNITMAEPADRDKLPNEILDKDKSIQWRVPEEGSRHRKGYHRFFDSWNTARKLGKWDPPTETPDEHEEPTEQEFDPEGPDYVPEEDV